MEKLEIHIVRALSKISNALEDIDALTFIAKQKKNKIFFGKMARDINKFDDFFTHHTKFLTWSMYSASPAAYYESVHYWNDTVNSIVEASTEEKKHLGLLFAKLLSAREDLEDCQDMDRETSYLVKPIKERIDVVTKKAYQRKLDINIDDILFLSNRFKSLNKSVIF